MKNIFFYLIFLWPITNISAQDRGMLKALNNYVDFTNEATHGLLIVHRLLENYNQEVNKYVDLPGYKINNISNKDLPRNLFKDEDHWFYQVTPYEWFAKIKNDENIIGIENHKKLFPIAKNMFKTINQINNIRFKIAELISSKDLSKEENLEIIYKELDRAVDLFDLYYAYLLNLENELRLIYPDNLKNKKERQLIALYDKSIDLLKALRVKNRAKIKMENGLLSKISKEHKKNNSFIKNKRCKEFNLKILASIDAILSTTSEIELSPKVAGEYKLYGKHYYYYNVKVIDKYNKYGNGYIQHFNDLLRCNSINILKRFELPHYFKVIRPKKKIKKVKWIKASINNINSIPKDLDGRLTKYATIHSIEVSGDEVDLELFDYKIQDGDIVSINFNGDWIYKNLSLETKPKKIKLKLNKTGKNYMVLHAVNEGRRPPNTIGINYIYKGEKKTIVLESNLKKSDLVQFIIKDSN